jgi:translation initiation factor 1
LRLDQSTTAVEFFYLAAIEKKPPPGEDARRPQARRLHSFNAMKSRLVWTSDPEAAKKLRQESAIDAQADHDPSKQTIRVVIDRKRRAGKSVTVASGFQLTAASLSELAASLKKRCGAGGTAGDGEIEIQGDHLARVAAELERLGYRVRPG